MKTPKMGMVKIAWLLLTVFLMTGTAYRPLPLKEYKTQAPEQHLSEIEKLKTIFDKHKKSEVTIFADGTTRPVLIYFQWVRDFLRRTFRRKDTAAVWIERHT